MGFTEIRGACPNHSWGQAVLQTQFQPLTSHVLTVPVTSANLSPGHYQSGFEFVFLMPSLNPENHPIKISSFSFHIPVCVKPRDFCHLEFATRGLSQDLGCIQTGIGKQTYSGLGSNLETKSYGLDHVGIRIGLSHYLN
ncbi:unnamed protein product [Caretta caretta]